MSQERRQDLLYPPGPRPDEERDEDRHRSEPILAPAQWLHFQLQPIRHNEAALEAALRRLSPLDRLSARLVLSQLFGGHYTGGIDRAVKLCERVWGPGSVDHPIEREWKEEQQRRAERRPMPPASTLPEAQAAYLKGRVEVLRERLAAMARDEAVPSRPEFLTLLWGTEDGVARAALAGLAGRPVLAEQRGTRDLYDALSVHFEAEATYFATTPVGRKRLVPLPGAELPRPETRVLGQVGGRAGGVLLGSWDAAASQEERARREALCQQVLSGEPAALRLLGQGSGEPLPEAVLGRMNRLFGHDFSHVRIHTDARAAEVSKLLGARALACGTHLYFGAGQFAPGTPAGDRLLAHELMHVVQHDRGQLPRAGAGSAVSQPGDHSEREAAAAESLPTRDGATSDTGRAAARAPEPRPGSPGSEAHGSTVHRKAEGADNDGSNMSLWGVLKQLASVGLSTLWRIVSDPIGFVSNLFAGVKAGLRSFVSNIRDHLKEGLLGWLTGSLGQAGLELPKTLDEKGIFSLAAQLLQVTYQNIRARAVKRFGEPAVARLEKVSELWKTLTRGPAALWEQLKEQLTSLPGLVLGTIKDFVLTRIITAGIEWILSLLNPASALAKVAMAVYRIIKFFVQRAAQIAALGQALLQSLSAIARGVVTEIAQRIEAALVRALPVVIGFLASLLRLDGIGEQIRKLLAKVRVPIEKALDWVIEKAWKLLQRAGKALGIGKEKDAKDDQHQGSKGPKDGSDTGQQSEIKVEFAMQGTRHTLFAVPLPNGKHRIDMASDRGPIIGKLKQALATARRAEAHHNEDARQEVEDLQGILSEVQALESQSELKPGQIKRMEQEISSGLAEIGRKYKLHSLSDAAHTLGNADRRTPLIVVTSFVCRVSDGFDLGIFAQAVQDQEDGLNSMTCTSYEKNRTRFMQDGRSKEGTSLQRAFGRKTGKEPGTAAPHNPDQIAGGHADPTGIPLSSRVNASIGVQWKTRILEVDKVVAQVKEEEKSMTQLHVKLTVEAE